MPVLNHPDIENVFDSLLVTLVAAFDSSLKNVYAKLPHSRVYVLTRTHPNGLKDQKLTKSFLD